MIIIILNLWDWVVMGKVSVFLAFSGDSIVDGEP